jgi:hypothetical protein
VTDSERFYASILDLFEDVEEAEEVNDLLTWWNRYGCDLAISLSSKVMHVVRLAKSSPIILLRGAPFPRTALWRGLKRNGRSSGLWPKRRVMRPVVLIRDVSILQRISDTQC